MNISKKLLFWSGVVLFAAACAYFYSARERGNVTDLANYPPQSPTVVAFGDSLTFGFGSTKGNDFVTLLSSRMGIPIANRGVPGDTTVAALGRIDSILALNPGVTIVYLGGNDFLRRVPIDETFGALETIVMKLQEQGSVVVLVGIRGGLINDQYARRFEDLSKKYKALYVPDLMFSIIGQKDQMHDSIHPNDAGYARIAESIYERMKFLFPKD